MKTFLILDNNNNIISSYQADEKDETSNYRPYLHCPPHAHHYECPSNLNKDCVKLEYGIITPEQAIVLQPEVLYQAEIVYKAAVLDADSVTVLEPEVLAQPEILAQSAVIEVIPAVLGMRLVEDSVKVSSARQVKANANLDTIRQLRNPLLDEADKKINILMDEGLDATSWRAYRKALRDCTIPLKKVDGSAKLSCETLIPSEFIFPIKAV